jgi:hypothetical protein
MKQTTLPYRDGSTDLRGILVAARRETIPMDAR